MTLTEAPVRGLARLFSASLRGQGRRAAVAVVMAAALAGCGGGVYVGYDGTEDHPPDVSVAVSPGAAFEDELVNVVAAATDDFAVRRVDFFRSDSVGGVEFLGSVFSPPYSILTPLPLTPDGGVSYSARAIDDNGQATDSAWVVVRVLR